LLGQRFKMNEEDNKYLLERMKREIDDEFLELSDILDINQTIKLINLIIDERFK